MYSARIRALLLRGRRPLARNMLCMYASCCRAKVAKGGFVLSLKKTGDEGFLVVYLLFIWSAYHKIIYKNIY